MDKQVDVIRLIKYFKSKILVIIILGLLGGTINYIYNSFFVKPLYASSFKILVLGLDQPIKYTNFRIYQKKVNTYLEVINSDQVLEPISKQFNQYSLNDLRDQLVVVNDFKSQVITLGVKAEDPYLSQEIAKNLFFEINKVISKTFEKNYIQMLDEPSVSNLMVFPDKKLEIKKGIYTGVLTGFIIFLVLYALNTTIKSTKDIESITGIKVIGRIPNE